jgi:DNA polymerase-1
VAAAEKEMRSTLNSPSLNLNSPTQVKTALGRLGVEVPDTKAETLAGIDAPAARVIVTYREAEKAVEQLRSLLDAIESDGRLHTNFNPLGCKTGRFSSSKPNLQNVARGETRSCFIAPPGYKLIDADYSQIELRVIAAIAGEPRMLEALRKGDDLHLRTAEILLNRQAKPGDRTLAKSVNFGLIYGQGARGLARYAKKNYDVTMSVEEATCFREAFFAEYEALARFHREAWQEAEHGAAYQTRTRLGRRRLLPTGSNQTWERFSTIVNSPIQGSCADGMKLAMVKLAGLLPAEAKIILTIHDELLVLAPDNMAEAVKHLVAETMVKEMQTLFPEVPIEVEARVLSNWSEK